MSNPIITGTTSNPVGIATFGAGTSGIQGGSAASLGAAPAAIGQSSSSPIQGSQVNPGFVSNTQSPGMVLSANTTLDPAAVAAAANAAKAGQLRGDITHLVNSIKDIFNSRYGQVDAAAGEQVGKLNDRFGNESQDLAGQIAGQNAQIGAGAASNGTFDSSYRGNNVDTSTKAGESQIRDLGTELQDNIAQIAQWVAQQKAGFDAEKSGQDAILSHLNEETNPDNLVSLRNTLDSKIASLQAGKADNQTQKQAVSALATIAPSNARAVQLKTTLASIVGGNADTSQKAAIGARLIQAAGLDPDEQQKLAQAFQSDLGTTDQTKQQA
jgi:hypothetical protein